jgi:hypothetical protein
MDAAVPNAVSLWSIGEIRVSQTWEVFYRDGRPNELIECDRSPIELTIIATGKVYAVQLHPVEGEPRLFPTSEVARIRKVSDD